MTRPRLILLDTNVVLRLFELEIWESVTKRFRIVLTETVVEESQFFMRDGERIDIDWAAIRAAGSVEVRQVSLKQLEQFRAQFDATYLERFDPGETEAMTLLKSERDSSICSADAIVWRVLGNTGDGERGVSLEELLQQAGLSKPLPEQFSRAFRDKWTRKGVSERFMGFGRG
jgi:hypothetical protein